MRSMDGSERSDVRYRNIKMWSKPDEPASYQNVTYALGTEGDGTAVTITQDGCADTAEAERMSANWSTTLEGMRGVIEARVR